jgi:hypothetical protein
MNNLLGFIFLLASLGVIYLPRFVLWRKENLSLSELREKFPAEAWTGEAYPVLMYLWCAVLGIGLWLLGSHFAHIIGSKGLLALFTVFPAGLALFEGVFSLFTRVFPVSTRTHLLYYVTQREDLGRLSILQVSVSLIIICGVLIYYWY